MEQCQRRRHWDVMDCYRLPHQRVFFYGSSTLVFVILSVLLFSQNLRSPRVPEVGFSDRILPPPSPRIKQRNEDNVYICCEVLGHVGNAFFNYMSLLGLARTNNMTLVLKDSSVLPEVLENPPRTAPGYDEKCSNALFLEQRRCCVLDENLIRLPHDDFYCLKGCLISWRYFENMKDEVKTALAFRRDVRSEAERIVSDFRTWTPNVTLVGMHVRRGDQSGLIAYMHGHNPVTPEYIFRAMHYFIERFRTVHFVAASNDADWCRDNFAMGRDDVTIMEGNSAAVDMAVLTMTDHMIISIGTFGWWAGYLNPGIKTYMKGFVRADTSFSESFDDLDGTDYIYPGWIPL